MPDRQLNRDDQMKPGQMTPGQPPRPAQEPDGAESSSQTSKTATDPATGQTKPGAPAPNQAQTDQTDGA